MTATTHGLGRGVRIDRLAIRAPSEGCLSPSSRRTVSGEKAGTHTATYSAPSASGVL